MVIRGSRKLLIKQLDTSPIEENFVGARRRDADQIGPRVMVFDADRVFAHEICKALDRGWRRTFELKRALALRLNELLGAGFAPMCVRVIARLVVAKVQPCCLPDP